MLSILDITTSGLIAQKTRLNTISSNIANMSTVRNEAGENVPYQARYVEFQTDNSVTTPDGAVGVKISHVRTNSSNPLMKYEPHHPLADSKGYVKYPNISMTAQMVDALEATRAYEANIGVIEITKNMSQQTLRILG